jgi:hypothetical protein
MVLPLHFVWWRLSNPDTHHYRETAGTLIPQLHDKRPDQLDTLNKYARGASAAA